MPDPLLFLKEMVSSAVVSAIVVLMIVGIVRPAGTRRQDLACVLAFGLGIAAGGYVRPFSSGWPPVSGLDRFLLIVIPTILGIELTAGLQWAPARLAWPLRISLAVAIPRIILHGSVYLNGSDGERTPWQLATESAVCVALLSGVWALIAWLFRRSPGVSIPLSLSLATQCAGITIMMAGYIKGGAAAFALATALATTAIALQMIAKLSHSSPCIGIGVVGLFGLLFVGSYFGRLSTGYAIAIWLSPLLCCLTEVPMLRRQKRWIVASLRLFFVFLPLVVVLILAKRDFDRDMRPLLSEVSKPSSCGFRQSGHEWISTVTLSNYRVDSIKAGLLASIHSENR